MKNKTFKIIFDNDIDVDYRLHDSELATKWFQKIKHLQNIPIDPVTSHQVDFSNLKDTKELERKYLNDENHAEYEKLGNTIDDIKLNMKNRTIDYNHSAKKNSPDRFNQTKLEIVDFSLLPKIIKDNKANYKEWLDI